MKINPWNCKNKLKVFGLIQNSSHYIEHHQKCKTFSNIVFYPLNFVIQFTKFCHLLSFPRSFVYISNEMKQQFCWSGNIKNIFNRRFQFTAFAVIINIGLMTNNNRKKINAGTKTNKNHKKMDFYVWITLQTSPVI